MIFYNQSVCLRYIYIYYLSPICSGATYTFNIYPPVGMGVTYTLQIYSPFSMRGTYIPLIFIHLVTTSPTLKITRNRMFVSCLLQEVISLNAVILVPGISDISCQMISTFDPCKIEVSVICLPLLNSVVVYSSWTFVDTTNY